MSSPQVSPDDLRSFISATRRLSPKDYLQVDDPVSGDWELAAVTSLLVKKMRMPLIEYSQVIGSQMPVVHNVCASLSRVAKSKHWSVQELEERLQRSYDRLIPPMISNDAPVRQIRFSDDKVNLYTLPSIRYTESETHPYISAAHIVAMDPRSNSLNVSFHRMMIVGHNKTTLFISRNSHLDEIFRYNQSQNTDTPIAGFIGAHPLWSLGALAAGSIDLDEYSVIGGILGLPLPVAKGIEYSELVVPAKAELAFEGRLSATAVEQEGPYGEAFGFVSERKLRPVMTISHLTHRKLAIFQDIVPGELEHLTMTGVALKCYLQKHLNKLYNGIKTIFLPAPMTIYLSVTPEICKNGGHELLNDLLNSQRFLKHAVIFDEEVDISNAKQTALALALNVQADKDLVVSAAQPGNELDPSETNDTTTKWGIDATSYTKAHRYAKRNMRPSHIDASINLEQILSKRKAA